MFDTLDDISWEVSINLQSVEKSRNATKDLPGNNEEDTLWHLYEAVWDGEGTYLVPMAVCSSVHNPDTKKMVEMSWLLAALLSLMQSGSARMSGIAMMPPKARM